jgi:hypothetical protein
VDYDLDASGAGQTAVCPGVAGGFLIEAKAGTWMLGMGVGMYQGLEDDGVC